MDMAMPIKGNWLGEKNWDTDYKWEDKRITYSKKRCHMHKLLYQGPIQFYL